jgi:hypothetical protein
VLYAQLFNFGNSSKVLTEPHTDIMQLEVIPVYCFLLYVISDSAKHAQNYEVGGTAAPLIYHTEVTHGKWH